MGSLKIKELFKFRSKITDFSSSSFFLHIEINCILQKLPVNI